MPDGLHDRDILVWAEQQSGLLRRIAAGERVNDAVDWPHLIEEVEDLGLAELKACESLLRQAMLHLIKLAAGADRPAAHWRGEVLVFLTDAAARATPSIRQRIDLEREWRRARKLAAEALGARLPTLPEPCPFTLADLLDEDAGIAALVRRLGP